ncbi:MAG: porphobilinogen synthase [Pseudomonadota bacterium]
MNQDHVTSSLYGRAAFPKTRMRRSRQSAAIRDLVAESYVTPADIIAPLFICAGQDKPQAIASMPGQYRFTADDLQREVESLLNLGIQNVLIFPKIAAELKTMDGSEGYRSDGLVPTILQQLKSAFPELTVMVDVALDPYTSHGQDGILNARGIIENDITLEALKKQSICYAEAGADVLGPSDMMDGRIQAIRSTLEARGLSDIILLSYAAKYASGFYGPFRDAVNSSKALGKADKRTYQMDFRNSDEALHEVALDLAEGADWVMVKPGLPYLDIIYRVKNTFKVPTLAYHVSGEFSMLHAAAEKGWLDLSQSMHESLISFKRAGANAIVTYFAKTFAEEFRSKN